MAYATVDQLESRWRTLTTDERTLAEVLLEDASIMLAGLVSIDESDEDQAAILEVVCCNMVKRSMVANANDVFGVSEMTATMGPFSQQVGYTNPTGDMYLTKSERQLLGIGYSKGRILMYAYNDGSGEDA